MPSKFNGNEALKKWQKQCDKNLQAAAILIVNEAKKEVNTTPAGIRKVGERRVATTKATKGAAPRKITGYFQRSIAYAKITWQLIRIGTGVLYGAVHEHGYHKWLIPTVDKLRQRLRKILCTPSK